MVNNGTSRCQNPLDKSLIGLIRDVTAEAFTRDVRGEAEALAPSSAAELIRLRSRAAIAGQALSRP